MLRRRIDNTLRFVAAVPLGYAVSVRQGMSVQARDSAALDHLLRMVSAVKPLLKQCRPAEAGGQWRSPFTQTGQVTGRSTRQ